MVQLRHLGGVRATVPGEICLFALGVPTDEQSTRAVESSLTVTHEIVAPEHVAQYPSFVEQPADAADFFDAASWRRLREIKALYDPDDLVRGNHHVPPPSGTAHR